MNINWKIFGATLTSTLTILAALPYQLGDLATIIPPKWKADIVIAGLVATTLLRLWNTKMTDSSLTTRPLPEPTEPTPVKLEQAPGTTIKTTETKSTEGKT